MGLIGRVMASWGPPSISDDGHWTTRGGGVYGVNSAGILVTEETALGIPTVFDCNYILCDAVGQVPLILYDRVSEDKRERATTALAYRLREQPNDDQAAIEFKRQMQQSANFYEFAYAEIEWRGDDPVNVWPRHPSRITPGKLRNGQPAYTYLETDGRTKRTILPENMLRVPGRPVLRYAGETLGQAIALDRYSSRLFGRAPRPAAVIEAEKGVEFSDPAKAVIRKAVDEHAGEGSGRMMWLPEGLHIAPYGMTNQQAEYAALRSGVIAELARWWRIPPYMLGLLESGTVSYASVNTQGVDFVVYTLMPWLVGWEQAISRDLIVAKGSQFAEFLAASLLRGTTKERYDVYAIALVNGIMSVNEIRRLENLNPRAGGDTFLQQLNMAPAARHIDAGSPADRLLQALTADAAGTVVRRETGALARLAEKSGPDAAAWEQGVHDFYESHAAYVVDRLKVPMGAAIAYATGQAYQVLAEGPGVVAQWTAQTTDRLVNLALTEGTREVTVS